ncbi:hypothetical protein FDA94_28685 [Herbidospora galbida]|uniref:Uncharacterized protein n=1 Tax=Herbidospora galbida TaxID=2575442 RepID=A0A4U3M6P8_9ACTN|nr:hypothetical protein [Herbidospora galbida]TKK84608.1 hypothetical protein FDA94_28685 [Herbidospora galbida]
MVTVYMPSNGLYQVVPSRLAAIEARYLPNTLDDLKAHVRRILRDDYGNPDGAIVAHMEGIETITQCLVVLAELHGMGS